MKPKKFVNLKNTADRPDKKYAEVIANIAKDGVCPFCPDQLAKYHKNPILEDGQYWLVTKNMYPYRGAKHHLLLIHKEHITVPEKMSHAAWQELQEMIVKTNKRFDISGGTFFIRFGNTKYTGASVDHLHAHIVVSDPDSPDYAPLLARVG